jgi:hypothetical protein
MASLPRYLARLGLHFLDGTYVALAAGANPSFWVAQHAVGRHGCAYGFK